ncbi:exopolysaccharide biosynthesis polyprenyl glycosylphosphotransferase [Sphingomonas sp. LY29]|uniref:exopolysaccharide biosynthesis polyprenyl glycosylphosphotransferase n=1 Tax=Sphingomonas sp. LY29 TaxID=3095341 RepID=UPI002D7A18B0|nr:exopolysaccharide biosynthesis polyprenyl glycosylphosphotransferase [Sphingomonas sp. LY29]WRP26337.1 exopolysaccharide biosynthesis polyprenyl glycosylphosphotransferase [Sphingomonas sp. LY29]
MREFAPHHRPLDLEFLRSLKAQLGAESRARRRLKLVALAVLVDAVMIALCGTVAHILLLRVSAQSAAIATLVLSGFYFPVAVAIRAYSRNAFGRVRIALQTTMAAVLFAILAVSMATFLTKSSEDFSRLYFVFLAAMSAVAISAARLAMRDTYRRMSLASSPARLMIVDGEIVRDREGYTVVDAERVGLRPAMNEPDMLHSIGDLVHHVAEVAVLAVPARRRQWVQALQCFGREATILMPELDMIGTIGAKVIDGEVALVATQGGMDWRARLLKRAFDLTLVILTLPILLPLLGIVVLAIKIDSPGPVLFRQVRVGRNNRHFDIYKFRSMHTSLCDANGQLSTQRLDKRVTRVGKLIRATSIDELPQLINVLKGDMSIVGPRPHALGSLAGGRLFWEIAPAYWQRHVLKPGLTGLAQVRGHRGATDHEHELENRLTSDLQYCAEWSLFGDIAILFRTAGVLVHRQAF